LISTEREINGKGNYLSRGYQDGTDLVIRISYVRERQFSVDHVVQDAAQTPHVRLESDFDNFGTCTTVTLILKKHNNNFKLATANVMWKMAITFTVKVYVVFYLSIEQK
jgi:hypothetical protein